MVVLGRDKILMIASLRISVSNILMYLGGNLMLFSSLHFDVCFNDICDCSGDNLYTKILLIICHHDFEVLDSGWVMLDTWVLLSSSGPLRIFAHYIALTDFDIWTLSHHGCIIHKPQILDVLNIVHHGQGVGGSIPVHNIRNAGRVDSAYRYSSLSLPTLDFKRLLWPLHW